MATEFDSYVKEHKPYDMEEDYPLDSEIEITFSVDMDKNTINTKNILVYKDDIRIDGYVEYKSRDKKAIFNPYGVFEPDTSYKVVLSGQDLLSISGEPLDDDYIFRFNTMSDNQLSKPDIEYPTNQSVIDDPVLKIRDEKFADKYIVEVSRLSDFSDIVLSKGFFGSETTLDLETDKEYFVRVKGKDVYNDEDENKSIKTNVSSLFYKGSNTYEYIVNETTLLPLKKLSYVKVDGVMLNLTEEEAFVRDKYRGIITIDKNISTASSIEFGLIYNPSKEDSPWSNTTSFYFEEEYDDWDDVLEEINKKDTLMTIEPTYNISTDSNEVIFEIEIGNLKAEDIQIALKGESISNFTEHPSHGYVSGDMEIMFSDDEKTVVRLVVENA